MNPTENNTRCGAAEFEERNDEKPPHVVIMMPDTLPPSILKPKSNAFWTKKRIVCVVMAILVLIIGGVGAVWYFYPREKESTPTSSSMHATPEKAPSSLLTATIPLPLQKKPDIDQQPLNANGQHRDEEVKPSLTATSSGSLHESQEHDAKSLFPPPPEEELPQQPMPMPTVRGIPQRAMETENAEAMKPSSTFTVADAKNLLSSYHTRLGWQKELIFGGEDGNKVFIDMVHDVKYNQQTWKGRKEIDFRDAADMGKKLNELVSVFDMTFDAIKFESDAVKHANEGTHFFPSISKMLKKWGCLRFQLKHLDTPHEDELKKSLVEAGFPIFPKSLCGKKIRTQHD